VLAGLYAFTYLQVFNDGILGIYALYLWTNHFDLRNLTFAATKIANNAMMIYSTFRIHEAVKV
jgi:hypothetical protein